MTKIHTLLSSYPPPPSFQLFFLVRSFFYLSFVGVGSGKEEATLYEHLDNIYRSHLENTVFTLGYA